MTRAEIFRNFIVRNKVRSFAEVGVFAGQFAAELLQVREPLERYYMIDNWHPGIRDIQMRAALEVANHDSRVVVIERESAAAAAMFREQEIEMVYIDAKHDYESVSRDIALWWPKTNRYLSGHDYALWNTCANCPMGTVPAVERFAESLGLEVQIDSQIMSLGNRLLAAYKATTIEPDYLKLPSWIVERPL